MSAQVFQVVGSALGQSSCVSWVAATYDDSVEANDHTDFLNGLLVGQS